MQKAGKGRTAMDIKKGKDVVGKHDAADHKPDHRKEHQQIHDKLKDAGGGILPMKQAFIPVPVEDMMSDKQKEHPCPRPLMRHITPELVSH